MFILDGVTMIIFLCVFALVYGILAYSENENFKTVESKIVISLIASLVVSITYAYFMSNGTEILLTDSYTDAASKFNGIGMDSVKSIADV